MNSTLFGKEFRANLPVTGIIAAVLAMYVVCVVAMYDPELNKSLAAMMASMPELFAAFGMATQTTSLVDFLINYLYGLLLTVMPFVLILLMVNKLIVRYVDRGTMAYLLATPNSRVRIATTMAGVLLAALAVLLAVTVLVEIGSSEAMFPGDLDGEALARVNAGLFALWLFLGGMCFLSACLFSNAGRALWVGGGLGVLFFLMQMMAQLGEYLEFLDAANPLTLYDAYGLASADASATGGAIALAVAGLALFAAAIAVFSRRDLSV